MPPSQSMQTHLVYRDEHRHISPHLRWLLYFHHQSKVIQAHLIKKEYDAKICLFIHWTQMKKMSTVLSSLTTLSGGKDKCMHWGLAVWKHWNCKEDCGDLLYNQPWEWLLISVRAFWRGTRGLIVHSCHIDILASVELGGLSGLGMSKASGPGLAGRQTHAYTCKTLSVTHFLPHIHTHTLLNFVQQWQWIAEKQLTHSSAGRHLRQWIVLLPVYIRAKSIVSVCREN